MTLSPLSQSSVEWIDEAMAHNNADDGAAWLAERTRAAHGATYFPPTYSFGTVDGFGNLIRSVA